MQPTDLRKKVGQLFAVGFHGLTPSPEIKTLIHEYGLGGIVLFKRNISDAAQLQTLTHSLQEEARLAGHEYPLFIGIDQENGLVTRISPPIAAQLPGPMALGATYAPELAKAVGAVTGETLRLFGINMNYAPVCDINSEPLNPVIGVRSFGDHPGFVGRLACATAHGLREQKVVPSVKHFPGHGDTAVDSHYGLPVISKTREQLDKCELRPFRRAAAEGIEAVMTAHISLPAIDDSQLPATLSAKALNILRKDMDYDGMVITDCLEMDGIRASYGTEQGAVLALEAGCDSIMVCHTYDVQVGSINKIYEAIKSGKVPTSRLEEAFRRVTALKARFLSWDAALKPQSLDGLTSLNQKGTELAKEAYSRSVTLVRDTQSILPLSPSSKIAFLFPGDKTPAGGAVDGEGLGRKGSYNASVYLDILRQWNSQAFEIRYGPEGLSSEQLSLIEAADVVIFASINARESAYQKTLGLELPRRSRSMVAMALCNPYDFLDDSSIQTYVATYEPTIEAFTVAVEHLFRPQLAKGSLPVGPEKPAPRWLEVQQYAAPTDFPQVYDVWLAALPNYTVSADNLNEVITPPPHLLPAESHHLVARTNYPESKVVGFCLLFVVTQQDTVCVQLAALAVDPKWQGRGVGTALLAECKAWMVKTFKNSRLELGSTFPRFWPGLPIDLPTEVREFFVHRGFQLNPPVPRSVDLYQDIKEFQSPEPYVTRAKERGYTFRPLETADYQECIVGQEKNFSYNQAWVQMYHKLDPSKYPSSVMTAFDPNGKQVGWTLMLSHESPMLKAHWAFPSLCGPKTGLIGCVGVDADYRKEGVGLAMLCHAIEDMKQRGVEGVFVDWVSLEGWYEKIGFKVWWSCRTGAMQLDA
ncbi:beta-N-acetylglucosaminidase [Aspergillus nomiae NRRL 13137]|uniref:Beta-N-acetylglucosaminidase n=1 Tax=Aspergillus nomiae NRRL (strain ATCC 15546 / NRRL 13137 / CBS 260.88 / M93) TaxID=1509407 RepID=A0A0L1J7N6_ASPN3|nr:beta-N-acetylglucosaminidase [Aspergillus nomiae NRRL 13137]KNG87690.1 beta-N-acetylglucosaminidase [Aspergillus nomiae NRRL 13137]